MIDEKKLIYDLATDLSIGRYGEYTDGSEYAFTNREVVDVILRQPKVGEWIPVSERLPEESTECVVTIKMKYEWEIEFEINVDVATYLDGDWCTFNDWFEGQQYYEVTAWMPLPEPYRKDVE